MPHALSLVDVVSYETLEMQITQESLRNVLF